MKKIVNGEIVKLTKTEKQEVMARQQEWESKESERTIENIKKSTEGLINKTAQDKGYKSDVDCLSWKNSSIASKKSHADSFFAWRDLVYIEMRTAIDNYNNGQGEFNMATYLESLPKIDWNKSTVS